VTQSVIDEHRTLVDCFCLLCREQCSFHNFIELKNSHDNPRWYEQVRHRGGKCTMDHCSWPDVCLPWYKEMETLLPSHGHFRCYGLVDQVRKVWHGLPHARHGGGCDPLPVPGAIADFDAYITDEFRAVRGLKWPRREFDVWLPRRPNDDPIPIVIIAPGAGDSPATMNEWTKITDMLEDDSSFTFGVLCLRGYYDHLDVSQGDHHRADHAQDDVRVLTAVLREINAVIPGGIDTAGIFCMGFSRGGRFCSRLGAEADAWLAGFATVAAVSFPDPNRALRKVPMFAIHGRGDRDNPVHGDSRTYTRDVEEEMAKYSHFNGCSGMRQHHPSGSTDLVRIYSGCTAQTQLVLTDGGHTWPGSIHNFPASMGGTGPYHATEHILRFFKHNFITDPAALRTASLELTKPWVEPPPEEHSPAEIYYR